MNTSQKHYHYRVFSKRLKWLNLNNKNIKYLVLFILWMFLFTCAIVLLFKKSLLILKMPNSRSKNGVKISYRKAYYCHQLDCYCTAALKIWNIIYCVILWFVLYVCRKRRIKLCTFCNEIIFLDLCVPFYTGCFVSICMHWDPVIT